MTTPPPSTPQPATSTRQPFVQFARGVAILTIVAYHFLQHVPLPPLLYKAMLLGGSGIYIFFFASGYGLALSRHTGWPAFFRRRFMTVLVPYYIAVTLIFIINFFYPIYQTEGWREYLSHILLYKMFVNQYTRNLGEHFWFISAIVQFYIVFPLLYYWLKNSRLTVVLLGSLLISVVYSAFVTWIGMDTVRVWYSFFLQYLWMFMLGAVIARSNVLPRLLALPLYVYALLMVANLGVGAGLELVFGQAASLFNDLFLGIGYLSGVVLLYRIVGDRSAAGRSVLWIESFSYSLYLIHMLVFQLYHHATAERPLTLLEVLLLIVLSVGAGLLFERLTTWVLQLVDRKIA